MGYVLKGCQKWRALTCSVLCTSITMYVYVCGRYDVVYSMNLGMYALCTRQYVAKEQESRKSVECDNKEKAEILKESSTTVRKSKLGFSPLALPTGENLPHHFAPWRFVLLRFVRKFVIDITLAYFWWILVTFG